jgi:hypothetical protein
MVVKGTVAPDSTLRTTVGWNVTIYSYKEPPVQMTYLPPVDKMINRTMCDSEGRFEFRLNVEDLAGRGISRIVVFAHPNPSEGFGWQVLDVKEGTYAVSLTASSLPPLPSAPPTASSASQSVNRSPQINIPGFPAVAILLGLAAALLVTYDRYRKRK